MRSCRAKAWAVASSQMPRQLGVMRPCAVTAVASIINKPAPLDEVPALDAQTRIEGEIQQLPPDVTLAFAPYAPNLEAQIAEARAAGHEVILQLPMEPNGYPANDPGPHTLLANATAEDNIQRLHWLLSRFSGYVGVTNYMGAKLSTSASLTFGLLNTAAPTILFGSRIRMARISRVISSASVRLLVKINPVTARIRITDGEIARLHERCATRWRTGRRGAGAKRAMRGRQR